MTFNKLSSKFYFPEAFKRQTAIKLANLLSIANVCLQHKSTFGVHCRTGSPGQLGLRVAAWIPGSLGRWVTKCDQFHVCSTPGTLCASFSLRRMPLHDWSLARDAVIISRRYYANFIGYPSQSAWSSKWHVWFASHCPSRRLSTWPTTAVSSPTALGALCGQLTFWLAWCREHSCCCSYGDRTFAAAGPRLWNSLPVHQLHNPDITCSDDSLREGNLFWGSMNTDGALWLLMRRQNTYASAYSRAIFSMCFFRKKPRAIRIRMYEGCQLDPSNRFDRTSTCDRHIHLAIDIRDSVVKIKIIGLWRFSLSYTECWLRIRREETTIFLQLVTRRIA